MKLLTLNTHSLEEHDYEKKLNDFVDAVLTEKPDIIALQEVNQSRTENILNFDELEGMTVVCRDIPIRYDNHALNVVRLLNINGLQYHWAWLPVKVGYGKYDEGIAVLSKFSIEDTDVLLISKEDDYDNWRTRKILGIKVRGEWFYSVHMGWWDDKDDPFIKQWDRIVRYMESKNNVWLMGDFNSKADVRDEGYDCVTADGWYDTYNLAEDKDLGITVESKIDGWTNKEEMRIDYIFTNAPVRIKQSKTVFNEKNYPVVSDHYGVMIEVYENER